MQRKKRRKTGTKYGKKREKERKGRAEEKKKIYILGPYARKGF